MKSSKNNLITHTHSYVVIIDGGIYGLSAIA